MIIVRLTVTNRPTQDTLAQELISEYAPQICNTVAGVYQGSAKVMLHTHVVTQDMCSYNLPDVLCEITAYNTEPPLPYADQLQEELFRRCPPLAGLHWVIGLSSSQNQYATSQHRPSV